jgi:DNA mismatch repair protein MutS
MRFNALALHEEASRIAEAGGHALIAEEAHFEELIATAVAARNAIAETAMALARLDVAAGQAERAAEDGWCRPTITRDTMLEIEGGRHPVVEAALRAKGERFVANDCTLSPKDRLWLVGGPNMGGKSTFLRQNALIVLLAQAGAMCLLRPRVSAWSIACSAVWVPRTILPVAVRPSWLRWWKPPPSCRRPRPAASSSSMKSGAEPRPMMVSLWPGPWPRRCMA